MQLCLDFCDVLRVDNIGIGAPGDFDRDVAWAEEHGRQTAARMVVVHVHRQCVRAWCRDQSGLRGMASSIGLVALFGVAFICLGLALERIRRTRPSPSSPAATQSAG